MGRVITVWHSNFSQEMDALHSSLNQYKLLSVDTEFPGFFRDTPRNAPASLLYDDLKFNVDSTDLIQLGVTLLDHHGNIGPTWEFNLRYDLDKENHVGSSIQFLEKNGLDFSKIKDDGIPRNLFRLNFLKTVALHHNLKWVTFHGIYDLAHLLKFMTGGKPLPNTAKEFGEVASSYFDSVFDLKLAAKHCEGLKRLEVGLARLSRILNVKRFGEAHNAGSDSLLTADIYARLMEIYGIRDENLDGILYGLEDVRIGKRYKPLIGTGTGTEILHPHQMPVPMHLGDHSGQPRPCYNIYMHPPPMVMPLVSCTYLLL